MKSKKIFVPFFFILLGSYFHVTAQTLKLNNGITFSSFSNSKKFDVLEQKIKSYSVNIGLDYWNRKQFYISSEVGYIKIGGYEKNPNLSEELSEIEETWDFIHFNSTLRLKLFSNVDHHLFIGAGPKMDLLVSDASFKSEVYSSYYEMEKFSFGAKTEIGLVRDLERIRLGLNASYLLDIGKKVNSGPVNLKNEIYQIMFSIGYTLGN
ncbi:outer membrane beta-barrel protein [Zunongwangia sp. F363]|uniref:Outer membrane beta-barrel protein n=1 Tax=Autumnicola tepida TaxID=3075595 RepID=A0ABU3C5Y1_9FLAO|nr:outer membrane beta-barrel protein [Zunongwangia sp. F363]MDT0641577.1 outer membrane beta-barrel protein [Zunongwangia sp. F363]